MRITKRFNEGWRFSPDENAAAAPQTKTAYYISAKTERAKWGPAAYRHNDEPDADPFRRELSGEVWQTVDLPHDYIIGQTPSAEYAATTGGFCYHNAWYRKHFRVPREYEGKRVTLLFDGVKGEAAVWLNGCLLKRNGCGYTPFEVDLTDYLRFDEENVLAVHVDVSLLDGWWYAGAGIYRDVWLTVTGTVSVDLYGAFVYPVRESDGWRVPIRTTVRNDGYAPAEVLVRSKIYAPDGLLAAETSTALHLGARSAADADDEAWVASPRLWDIDDPALYVLRTELVRTDGKAADTDGRGVPCDAVETRFGFRTARFDPKEGFFLNGRRVKLKGVCAHQDFGLTGIAVPDNIYRHRVRLLKEMGANAYRTSHYPHAPATMDALDEQGMLVLAEARRFESTPEALEQLALTIKRDRNRPSVILWSTGNEEFYHTLPQGVSIQKAMTAHLRRFDPYRPVTTAVDRPDESTVFGECDVVGVNYHMDRLDLVHAKNPGKPVVSTENCATPSNRGVYLGASASRAMTDARDIRTGALSRGREATWKYIAGRDWIAGGFQWIGISHRGEAIWPRLCSVSGAYDLFLQRKDAFYQNLSHWTDAPMIHLLPHWNFRGMEGLPIEVWAYTNCEEAELLLDGVSLGRQPVERYGHAAWEVSYRPGRLEAVGYRGGKPAARDVRETTGAPAGLRLRLENGPIRANGEDVALVSCFCVDAEGREVPDAEPLVHFDADERFGRVIGTGSAENDPVAVTCPDRRMFAGRISAAVRAGRTPGRLHVYARSETLGGAYLTIDLIKDEE